ncbi:MAG: phosphoribosyltransferase domain-containing protein [Methylococcaceae bacterium]
MTPPDRFAIPLATGTLSLILKQGSIPLNRLLGFAARVSSKRKFLLVSKILGKHYPVTPRLMRWSYRALARQVLKHGVGNASLWIGMAETATGLGYGIYEQACAEGLQNGLFMQTTRYELLGQERLLFNEEHSHATDFFLYYPTQPDYREQFFKAQTLVLIDDEISTGKTFLRLIHAYQAVNPRLNKVFIVSLVNFASETDRLALETQAGVSVAWLSFREGSLSFDDAYNSQLDAISVNASSNNQCKRHLLAWQGRLGINQPVRLADNSVTQAQALFITNNDDKRPLLVLGTGECNAPAYLLGRALEEAGFCVKVQSTTRSPIHVGNAIGSVCAFEDNYEDAITNYLYNLNPAHYREIILCHETPLNAPLLARCEAWQAISARFIAPTNNSDYAELYFSRP